MSQPSAPDNVPDNVPDNAPASPSANAPLPAWGDAALASASGHAAASLVPGGAGSRSVAVKINHAAKAP